MPQETDSNATANWVSMLKPDGTNVRVHPDDVAQARSEGYRNVASTGFLTPAETGRKPTMTERIIGMGISPKTGIPLAAGLAGTLVNPFAGAGAYGLAKAVMNPQEVREHPFKTAGEAGTFLIPELGAMGGKAVGGALLRAGVRSPAAVRAATMGTSAAIGGLIGGIGAEDKPTGAGLGALGGTVGGIFAGRHIGRGITDLAAEVLPEEAAAQRAARTLMYQNALREAKMAQPGTALTAAQREAMADPHSFEGLAGGAQQLPPITQQGATPTPRGIRPSPLEVEATRLNRPGIVTPEEYARAKQLIGPGADRRPGEGTIEWMARVRGGIRAARPAIGDVTYEDYF